MEPFFGIMASMTGRVARIIAGLALVLSGFLVLGGIWGWILAIVGLVPLLAGLCVGGAAQRVISRSSTAQVWYKGNTDVSDPALTPLLAHRSQLRQN
jgi:hypothetical protein